ncbi:MAG TPA: carboxypeptidase-like regulatory domain-containing protein [Ferruginibacter sp.]|nr:carboxypeptidase-like regulatory domain-containing protein [Ferruginibacter sp.]
MKIRLLLAMLLSTLFATAQSTSFSVSGKIINAETKLPLQAASVFAQNTTFGTATDASGHFTLWLPNGGYDLVVTFTGFQTETRRISTADENNKDIVIELKLKEKEMEAVSVVSTSEVKDGWEKYGNFFLEQFIGKTENSKYCSILNKEAIHFYFSKKRNRLKVLATEPIRIENAALGYQIKYTLDSFTHEYATQISLYTGYPLFEEKQATDETQKLTWQGARQKAYQGSILHFMRSVFQRRLKEEGFEVQYVVNINNRDSALRLKDFYTALNYQKDDSTQTVEIKPNQLQLGVIYTGEKPAPDYLHENPNEPSNFQFSFLSFLPNRSIIIEQNGYFFEQNDITINAYWTWDKVANLLPYDFTAP